MKLNVIKRMADKKSESKELRRNGQIPVAVYVRGKPSDTLAVNRAEIEALFRACPDGTLSTTIVNLQDENNKTRKAIIKDIQYHPTTYNILHMDFEELVDNLPINVNVPIKCIGSADCPGVKLGGVVRQVIRKLRVRCIPKDIPNHFEIDVSSLELNGAKRLSTIAIPTGVRPLADLNEVAVAIVKR